MHIDSRSLARGIRSSTAQWRGPILAAMTLAVVATSALTPATTQAQSAYTCSGSAQLLSGQSLIAHEEVQGDGNLCSVNGMTQLVMQPNGYLVLSRASDTMMLWLSGQAPRGTEVAKFVMQADGNLVVSAWQPGYTDSVPIWSTRTSGFPGARLVLRDDGNLIIVDARGYQRWATNTAWYTPSAVLQPGQKLTTGQQLLPVPDAMTRLILQSDGNLVLYRIYDGRALWASNTQGKPMTQVLMQPDGNLVGYTATQTVAYWRTRTAGHPDATLALRPDGNLVLASRNAPGTVYWATNTIVHCLYPQAPCPALP
jgi:hypothetical protein